MELSAIWSKGMVLQRGKVIRITGKARGNQVTACLSRQTKEATEWGALSPVTAAVGRDGSFVLELPPMEAGGPYELALYDGEKTVISDLLFGDVWLLGGQSNMQLPVSRTLDETEAEVASSDFPKIRMFQAPMEYDFEKPRDTYSQGSWIRAQGDDLLSFSAAGFFMAKELYEKNQVPVGLILTAIGGTLIESWMSKESLRQLGGYEEALERNCRPGYVQEQQALDAARIGEWHTRLQAQEEENRRILSYGFPEHDGTLPDCGAVGEVGTHEAVLERESTGEFQLPGMWAGTQLEGYHGSVWFQREIEVPKDWCGQEVLLRMGAIVDADETYVNGILVGHTDYRYPPRKYPVAPGILHPGKNRVTVRVISDGHPGAFIPGKDYGLEKRDSRLRQGAAFRERKDKNYLNEGINENWISLEGSWQYRLGVRMEQLEEQIFFQYEPTGVFHGMITPLKDYGVRGIAFYQGESNTHQPKGYAEKLRALLRDWRDVLGQGEVPFVYVQLPEFGDGLQEDCKGDWVSIRREQSLVQKDPGVAMVSAMGLGEYNDLHPQKKAELGRRLAAAAEKLTAEKDNSRKP